MNRLWAPWRMKYLKACGTKKCIFCENKKSKGKKNYIVFQTPYSIARLNIFPYNNGHILISPRRHIRDFSQLKENEILDLVKTLTRAKKILDNAIRPNGYNIGVNIAKSAGAGIIGHLHIHIVPRWNGDTNFMPAIFDTKIISQSLDELYAQLKKALCKIC